MLTPNVAPRPPVRGKRKTFESPKTYMCLNQYIISYTPIAPNYVVIRFGLYYNLSVETVFTSAGKKDPPLNISQGRVEETWGRLNIKMSS